MLMYGLFFPYMIFMTYWWRGQGSVSALLQLVTTIIAGALAFGLWEVFVIDLGLVSRMGDFAWGVGLLGPFILFHLLLRTPLDMLIKGNIHIHPKIDQSIAGLLGFMAAGLAVGITIIGLSYTRIGSTVGGYVPLKLDANGRTLIQPEGDQLTGGEVSDAGMVADRLTVNFFNMLSNGAFASSTPLKYYQPDLWARAMSFRLTDEYASLAAAPDDVEITRMFTLPAGASGLDPVVLDKLGDLGGTSGKLVIIETLWKVNTDRLVAYDSDQSLRVPTTQVRLVTESQSYPRLDLYPPFAGSQDFGSVGSLRHFKVFSGDDYFLNGVNSTDRLTFIFAIAADEHPRRLMVRNLRLEMPAEASNDPAMATSAVFGEADLAVIASGRTGEDAGSSTDAASAGGGDPEFGGREGAIAGIAALRPVLGQGFQSFSRNFFDGTLRLDATDETMMTYAIGIVDLSQRTRSQATAVRGIYSPSHKAVVSVIFQEESARSFLGKARSLAVSVQGVWLEDDRGNKLLPFGYSVYKPNARKLQLQIDPDNLIQSAKELPIGDMEEDDQLCLQFFVNRGARIVSVSIGSTTQKLNQPLDVPEL